MPSAEGDLPDEGSPQPAGCQRKAAHPTKIDGEERPTMENHLPYTSERREKTSFERGEAPLAAVPPAKKPVRKVPLTEGPHIELHDAVCTYLKGAE